MKIIVHLLLIFDNFPAQTITNQLNVFILQQ